MWSPCSNSCNPPSTTVLCCFTKGTHIQGGLIGNTYWTVSSIRWLFMIIHNDFVVFFFASLQKNILKVIVVGDPGVGKTSFIHRFTSNTFCEEYQGRIDVDFSTTFPLTSSLIPSQQAPLELTFQPPCSIFLEEPVFVFNFGISLGRRGSLGWLGSTIERWCLDLIGLLSTLDWVRLDMQASNKRGQGTSPWYQ